MANLDDDDNFVAFGTALEPIEEGIAYQSRINVLSNLHKII